MPNIKSIDEVIKGCDPETQLIIKDYSTFDNAMYVSKKDSVENVTSWDGTTDNTGSNLKAFEAMAKKIKAEVQKPVIVGAIDATHYNFVNKNMSWYKIEHIRDNAKTWIVKTDHGTWGRPIQLNHDSDQEKTIGRALVSTPFVYDKVNNKNLLVPDGHIELIYYVVDEDAIDRMIDGRYKTMSVSAGSRIADVECSICGRSVMDPDCPHLRGKEYADENTGKKQLCYWKFGRKVYSECSFVSKPADEGAVNKKMSYLNIQGMDCVDNALYNFTNEDTATGDSPIAKFSLMIGNMKQNTIMNLRDNRNNLIDTKYLITTDSTFDAHLGIATTKQSADAENMTGIASEKTPPAEDCGCQTCDEEGGDSDNPANGVIDKTAAISLIVDLLENNSIDLATSIDLAYEYGDLYVPTADRDSIQKSLDFMNKWLEAKDAKLTTAKRKSLNASTFCGPDRSWPVPDCEHVRVARAYLGNSRVSSKYSSSQLARIRACVNRKAQALGCDKKSKDNLNQEELAHMKYEFNTEAELLASAPVQKQMDELTSANEQKIDQIHKDFEEKEKHYRTIAVDAIVDMSTRLNKPLTIKLQSASAEQRDAVRKEVVDLLSKRSMDSLADTLNDLHSELSHKATADASQEALQTALQTQGIPAQASAAAQTTAADQTQTTAPAENLNNGGSASDEGGKPSILSSFTRKIS